MTELLFTIAALALAGFAKGIVGLGLPPIAMGLLVLFVTPVEAAATMVVPALLTNVWQAASGPYLLALLRRFWLMFALTALATVAFAGALASQAEAAIALLGVLLAIYGLYSLMGPAMALSPGAERWLSPVSGAATGVVTAFTGVSSMPSVPLLQSVGLGRDAFVQAMGLSFTVSAIALVTALGVHGGLAQVEVFNVAAATVAALLGMMAGARLRRSMDERVFRRVFLWGLIVLGLYLMLR